MPIKPFYLQEDMTPKLLARFTVNMSDTLAVYRAVGD